MSIKIRRFKKKDSKEVSNLIIKIFKDDNLKGVSKEGLNFFISTYSPKHISENWLDTYVIVAEDKGKIIAMARAKKNGWNTHLFVDRKYRGKDIARDLEKMREKWHRDNGNKIIKINSSLFSLRHHKKMGYKQTGNKKLYHGIPLYPMEKYLD